MEEIKRMKIKRKLSDAYQKAKDEAKSLDSKIAESFQGLRKENYLKYTD